MTEIIKPLALGAALCLGALAPSADASEVHGAYRLRFPGGQGGYHHPGSGFLHGAAGRPGGGRHDVHPPVWRGGFDGDGLY